MNVIDFIDELDKQERFVPVIEDSVFTDDGYLMLCDMTDKMGVKIPFKVIKAHDYKNINRVMEGGPESEIFQLTRVVGYFSKVQNWNPGKQSELQDRTRTDLSGCKDDVGYREKKEQEEKAFREAVIIEAHKHKAEIARQYRMNKKTYKKQSVLI